MTNEQYIKCLRKLRPCEEAIKWVDNRNSAAAWSECERGDWMLWLASKVIKDRKVIVLVCCKIACTVLHLVPDGEDRPRIAIETAERWVRGEATIDEVHATAASAYVASATYPDDAAVSSYAAYAAYAATDSAIATVNATSDVAASNNNRRKSLKESAEIVREIITAEMIEEALEVRDGD